MWQTSCNLFCYVVQSLIIHAFTSNIINKIPIKYCSILFNYLSLIPTDYFFSPYFNLLHLVSTIMNPHCCFHLFSKSLGFLFAIYSYFKQNTFIKVTRLSEHSHYLWFSSLFLISYLSLFFWDEFILFCLLLPAVLFSTLLSRLWGRIEVSWWALMSELPCWVLVVINNFLICEISFFEVMNAKKNLISR